MRTTLAESKIWSWTHFPRAPGRAWARGKPWDGVALLGIHTPWIETVSQHSPSEILKNKRQSRGMATQSWSLEQNSENSVVGNGGVIPVIHLFTDLSEPQSLKVSASSGFYQHANHQTKARLFKAPCWSLWLLPSIANRSGLAARGPTSSDGKGVAVAAIKRWV